MTKEFNLSEKELWMHHKETHQECYAFTQKDVKEFIKKDMELINLLSAGKITFDEFLNRRDKLVGDKLK